MPFMWRIWGRASGPSRRHRRPVRVAAFLAVASLGAATALLGTAAAPATAASGATTTTTLPFPDGLVHIDGHGFGPGVGMGQWGAFGYAAVRHKAYGWILAHFYGGTHAATTTDRNISVGIIENEGAPVVLTSPTKYRFGGVRVPGGDAAEAVLDTTTGLWDMYTAKSCAGSGGWTQVASGVTRPQAVPASQHPHAPAADLLTICRADGVDMTVRGIVRAVANDASGSPVAETVNVLPLDEYLADVVPSESSSGWGRVGGTVGAPQGEPWGFQELEAQAVAARTYALAYVADGGWQGYAGICDSDYCQSYPGTTNESAISTLAVRDTAGLYLTLAGQPAPTQYSASTGGWTAPSLFPAVIDRGDSVCLQNTSYWTCNAQHDWQATVPVKAVEATFPTIGTLEAVHVLSRDGLGQWQGRALTIKIRGSKGAVVETGDTFQSQFGLYSNWFIITHPTTTTSASSASRSGSWTATTSRPAPGATWPLQGGTGPLPMRPAGGLRTHPR